MELAAPQRQSILLLSSAESAEILCGDRNHLKRDSRYIREAGERWNALLRIGRRRTSFRNTISIRPTGSPPISMSRKTTGQFGGFLN